MLYKSAAAIAAACALATHSFAYAQTYLDHYQDYNAALASGDIQRAVESARDAWRAAEDAIGDDQTTAVLAYNYARMIYMSEPETAMEPIQRVIAIAGEDAEIFSEDPPIVMLRLCEAQRAPNDRKAKKRLRETMEAQAKSGAGASLVSARAWNAVALNDLTAGDYGEAVEAAGIAERQFRAVSPDANTEIRQTMMIAGVALMGSSRSDWDDRRDAWRRFNEVVAMSPPQDSIETFDPILASAMVWRVATEAANEASADARLQTGTFLDEDEPEYGDYAPLVWSTPRPAATSCAVNWIASPEPIFPAAGANRADQGAAMIGFHFNADGNVRDARILGENPARAGYGDNLLKAVKKWRASPLPDGCRKNHVVLYRFTVT